MSNSKRISPAAKISDEVVYIEDVFCSGLEYVAVPTPDVINMVFFLRIGGGEADRFCFDEVGLFVKSAGFPS